MDIEIQRLKKKDFNQARKFAIEGMNLNRYIDQKWILYLYSKYFWYSEVTKASQAIGAYMGDTLVGVILANIEGQPKLFNSFWYQQYVTFVNFIMQLALAGAKKEYDYANKEMLDSFKKNQQPDGEINFFVVDPKINGKGIGSKLLDALAKREKGKLLYLFTDSGCTYQFYERRGFERIEEKDMTLVIVEKEIPFTAFLYSKRM